MSGAQLQSPTRRYAVAQGLHRSIPKGEDTTSHYVKQLGSHGLHKKIENRSKAAMRLKESI